MSQRLSDRSVEVFGITLETITRRILRTFDRATSADVEAGARWYDEAGTFAANLSAAHDVTLEQAASVIAALSPRTSWNRNVIGAAALFCGGYDAALKVVHLTRNVDTAESARALGFAALKGPKTAAFARNIAGDRESVTVDVWAMRVANLDELLLSRVGAYDVVAHAYRLAARRRGVDPTTMQATTWVVARNGRAS